MLANFGKMFLVNSNFRPNVGEHEANFGGVVSMRPRSHADRRHERSSLGADRCRLVYIRRSTADTAISRLDVYALYIIHCVLNKMLCIAQFKRLEVLTLCDGAEWHRSGRWFRPTS